MLLKPPSIILSILLLLLSGGLLFFDYLSKAYVLDVLSATIYQHGRMGIPVFQNVLETDFYVTLAVNKGAAWGMFSSFPSLLTLVRIVMVMGLLFYVFFIPQSPKFHIPVLLIITGAIGNLLDSFLYGHVIDFLHFRFFGWGFPIFNFADIYISVGVIFLLYFMFAVKDKRNGVVQ